MFFKLTKKDNKTKARRGVIKTAHGEIQSPFFMPVGTNGTVKTLTFEDVHALNAQIVLSNTYHLYLRPGCDVIEEAGGLHKFIGWDGPMLTDSGGYQVFSLTKLRKIKDNGVEFQSHLDGSNHFFTPEKVVDIQRLLGTDMMMPLDVCAPYPCGRKEAERSVELTTEWAKRSKQQFEKTRAQGAEQYHFGIIQGATFEDLRKCSCEDIAGIDMDGFAIGGVSVGEPVEEMFKALDWVMPGLPEDKPRYFMGIGLPDQIVQAVGEGVDMFDTCIPTRYGRHGTAFTRKGRLNIINAEFEKDFRPIDASIDCFVNRQYSRGYIRHLIRNREISGLKLITFHNLCFYVTLMKEIREAIDEGNFARYREDFLREYNSELLQV